MKLELAKKRISELQYFVDLVENYETADFQAHVIKNYAITGSLDKTVDWVNELGFKVNNEEITKDDVVAVINTNKKVDDLHRLVRQSYRKKIKPSKSKRW